MKLNKLQTQFSESLFYQHDKIIEAIKETPSVTPLERLQIYRNTFIMSTTEALASTYQHTLSLVGEDFFNSVSREFILTNPPTENNIMTYGLGFNDYLHHLPQLTEMPYVSEMARFEWLLEQTTNLPIENKLLDITQLAQVTEDKLNQLQFQTPTQITLFQSQQNISHLYKMLLNNTVVESNLNTPCYLLLKKQPDFKIELISLTQDEFLLLEQIINNKPLGKITPQNLHQQLPSLLEKKLLNGFTIQEEL